MLNERQMKARQALVNPTLKPIDPPKAEFYQDREGKRLFNKKVRRGDKPEFACPIGAICYALEEYAYFDSISDPSGSLNLLFESGSMSSDFEENHFTFKQCADKYLPLGEGQRDGVLT